MTSLTQYQKTLEKSPGIYMKFKVNISKDNKECFENENLGKGNYSCKSRSNVTKTEIVRIPQKPSQAHAKVIFCVYR